MKPNNQSAPSPAEETASGCRCGGTGEVCYSSTSYGPCPECVKRNALPEPVSPEVLGTCADICGPHPEGSHPGCDMWRPGPVSPEGSAKDAEVMRLWRQAGLPEYFLGNGGTNHKLVKFAALIAPDSAPEAATPKCVLCLSEGGEYHAELRSGKHLYGLCEGCADLWDGSAEEPQLMVAAPIAPAADELIQELENALQRVLATSCGIADGPAECFCGEVMSPDGDLDEAAKCSVCLADAALTRAEEYRKGAKNV